MVYWWIFLLPILFKSYEDRVCLKCFTCSRKYALRSLYSLGKFDFFSISVFIRDYICLRILVFGKLSVGSTNVFFFNFNIHVFFYRLTIRARCPMVLKKYPMDEATCHLNLGSCKYLFYLAERNTRDWLHFYCLTKQGSFIFLSRFCRRPYIAWRQSCLLVSYFLIF